MGIRIDEWGRLVLWGSAGNQMAVGRPDHEGLMEFETDDEHHGTATTAHLGPEERRELIDWLRCD
jgi:hypothetical protein